MRSCLKLGIAAIALTGLAATASAKDITFMTGPAGGTWFPLGGATKQFLEKDIDGLNVTIRPGAGLLNVKGIATGKAHIAWGNVISTVDALQGKAPFKKKHSGLCNIGALYMQYAQVPVTDMSVNTIGDLKGKRLATLPRGNTTEVATQMLLGTNGMTYKDLSKVNFASITDQINMMKDGQIDGLAVLTSIPSGALMDLSSSRKVRFLPLTDTEFANLRKRNPGWVRAVIPAGSYPGVDKDVKTASFPMHFMANCSAIDEDLGYKITKSFATNIKELGAVKKGLEKHTLKDLTIDIGVPFHPGAIKYYKEVGAM